MAFVIQLLQSNEPDFAITRLPCNCANFNLCNLHFKVDKVKIHFLAVKFNVLY